MNQARDLLLAALLLSVSFFGRRGREPWGSIGPPSTAPPCLVAVEVVGAGIGCLSPGEAERARLVGGDRLRLVDGRLVRERMAPGRLWTLSAPVDVNRASA